MEIALLGGTGDFGEGLALRWAYHTDHDVVVGSRDGERARATAAGYERTLTDRGVDATVEGADNATAAARADIAVCTVPPYHLTDTVASVADSLSPDDVLVSPAVGMKHDEDGAHYNRPNAGSVTALAARAAPEDVPVVGAYHNLPAGRLADLDADLTVDTPVVGDDPDAVDTVVAVTEDIDGLGARRAGPLANAPEVEALTALLINVGKHDELHDVGVRFE